MSSSENPMPEPSQPYPPPSQPAYPPQYTESLPLHLQPPDWRYWPPPWQRVNHKAELAQMFGWFSLLIGAFLGIPAIIFALLAYSEIARTGEGGTKQANIGLLLGIISLVISAVLYIALFAPRY